MTYFKLSENFPINIDTVPCQQAPMYLLSAMEDLGSDGKIFTREKLVEWMEENLNNENIKYNKKLKSIKNLKNYWNLAHKEGLNGARPHNARILNFKTYYIKI